MNSLSTPFTLFLFVQLLLLFLNGLVAQAQIFPPPTYSLVPRKVFFAEPDKSQILLSPDGQKIGYLSMFSATPQIWIVDVATPTQPKCVSFKISRPVVAWQWALDNQHLLLVRQSEKGSTLSKISLSSLEEKDITPIHQNSSLRLLSLSLRSPEKIAIAIQSKDSSGIYLLDYQRQKWIKQADLEGADDWYLDANFEIKARRKPTPNGGHILERKTTNGWQTIAVFPWDVSHLSGKGLNQVISLTQDGSYLYYTDNSKTDKTFLKITEISTGNTRTIYADAKSDILPEGATIDPTTGKVQAVVFYFGKLKRHLLDKSLENDFINLEKIKKADIGFVNANADHTAWLVKVMDGGAHKYYFFDRKTQKAKFLWSEVPLMENYAHLLPIRKTVEVPTRDGWVIPCNLYYASYCDRNWDEQIDKPIPTILYIHGGPWIGFTWNNWWITRHLQLLASRGYAVLHIDFRGSLGYGKRFLDASNKEWGSAMQGDIVDIAEWAVANKIALKGKIGLFGWSYGGYATLAGLTFQPQLFQCGVALYGISDLEGFCKLPFAQNQLWRERVGNTEDAQDLARLRKFSPIHFVDSIRSPILISHGSKDNRVPQYQSDLIANALQNKQKIVTYLLYPEEAHDYRQPENWISFWAMGERFLNQYLGGYFEPYQDDLKKGNFQILYGREYLPELDENK